MLFLTALSFCLLGADGEGQGGDERTALETTRQTLHQKIKTLEREQDFLLFQKEMYATDSKYLVLNMTRKTGQLKYKSRILKTFPFVSSGKVSRSAFQAGKLVLTKKVEGKKSRSALIFGPDLILQAKNVIAQKKKTASLFLTVAKKDMRSIFSAVEEGAMAYVLR